MGDVEQNNLTEDGYYKVVQIPVDSALTEEPLGTKEKFWLVHEDGRRWLFKYNRERDRKRPGESEPTGDDWAEGIAGELAKLLGLPHALSFLAERVEADGSKRRGVAVWDFTRIDAHWNRPDKPSKWEALGPLIHGNEMLYLTDTDYPAHDIRGVYQHTVTRLMEVLKDYRVGCSSIPISEPFYRSIGSDGRQHMVGYLMLDAWIGNTDRHHENWGAIQIKYTDNPSGFFPDATYELAPTYDHAASLGSILTEAEFQERLTTKDRNRTVSAYIDRGRSAFYEDNQQKGKSLPMIDVFRQAAAIEPKAAQAWLEQLDAVQPDDWRKILHRVPPNHMTQAARDFVDAFLTETRKRLLNL